MKKIIFILLVFISACTRKEDVYSEFNRLKNIDFSGFDNVGITYRKGTYFISYGGETYIVRSSIFTQKLTSIEKDGTGEIPEGTIQYLKQLIKSFEKLGVTSLSVDEKKNVLILLFWHDRCAYQFLKLMPDNLLKNLDKEYFIHYENDWYISKECSKR